MYTPDNIKLSEIDFTSAIQLYLALTKAKHVDTKVDGNVWKYFFKDPKRDKDIILHVNKKPRSFWEKVGGYLY